MYARLIILRPDDQGNRFKAVGNGFDMGIFHGLSDPFAFFKHVIQSHPIPDPTK
jgi:hypothetical protein